MSTLYLIRHGQASYGTDDYDRLSPLGAEQSRLTGEWFRRCGFDVHHAVAGALKRHIQTGEAFFEGYSGAEAATSLWLPRIKRDANFNEVDQVDMMNPTYAERTGPLRDGTAHMTFAEFRQNLEPAYYRWTGGKHDHEYRMPYPVFRANCKSAVDDAIRMAQSDETVVSFTSGGTIAMICREVWDLGDAATSSLMWLIWNTSVTRLVWDGKSFVVELFNSTAHLDHKADKSIVTIT